MHFLQKRILDSLRLTSQLRYSQLQPDDIESSHFKYHLNQLIKEGLVEQVSRGVYTLTTKGHSTVDRLSGGRTKPHTTPKVITYTLLKDSANYYLQLKTKDPYRGLLNMIGGKVHMGETADAAARREVSEKAGFDVDHLRLCGVADVRISTDGSLLSHVTAYVYVADLAVAPPVSADLTAIPLSELERQTNLAPDLLAITAAINEQTSGPFVIELSITL